MSDFTKVSELTGGDRKKVKGYFCELYGTPYAKDMVTDYKPDGKQKEVSAKTTSTKK